MSRARRSVRKEAGFTLVEMAIVLIIIGLIIGAILKGQDLIDNARAKRLASFIRGAEVGQWAYYDRFGKFAGDADGNGIIGDEGAGNTEDPISALGNELDSFSNTLNLGSLSFSPAFGQNGTQIGMVLHLGGVNTASSPPPAFDTAAIIYARSFDVAVDGSSDAAAGSVMALTGVDIGADNLATNFAQVNPAWDTTAVGILYNFD